VLIGPVPVDGPLSGRPVDVATAAASAKRVKDGKDVGELRSILSI